jgi:hypothetical protein
LYATRAALSLCSMLPTPLRRLAPASTTAEMSRETSLTQARGISDAVCAQRSYPVQRSPDHAARLSSAIRLAPGCITIHCQDMPDLLQQLVQFAKALDNDYAAIQTCIEGQIPRRPVDSTPENRFARNPHSGINEPRHQQLNRAKRSPSRSSGGLRTKGSGSGKAGIAQARKEGRPHGRTSDRCVARSEDRVPIPGRSV